jgi:hypothetical protein
MSKKKKAKKAEPDIDYVSDNVFDGVRVQPKARVEELRQTYGKILSRNSLGPTKPRTSFWVVSREDSNDY